MKKVNLLASLIAVLSVMLISAGQVQAHPGCQGTSFEENEDSDGDSSRLLLEEEEGEEEEELRVALDDCEGDGCEDDNAERAVLDDDCEDDDAERTVFGDDCEEDDKEE